MGKYCCCFVVVFAVAVVVVAVVVVVAEDADTEVDCVAAAVEAVVDC